MVPSLIAIIHSLCGTKGRENPFWRRREWRKAGKAVSPVKLLDYTNTNTFYLYTWDFWESRYGLKLRTNFGFNFIHMYVVGN